MNMIVMVILIVISLTMAISFLVAFLWAIKSNQYEDMFTPTIRILTDENEINRIQINKEN